MHNCRHETAFWYVDSIFLHKCKFIRNFFLSVLFQYYVCFILGVIVHYRVRSCVPRSFGPLIDCETVCLRLSSTKDSATLFLFRFKLTTMFIMELYHSLSFNLSNFRKETKANTQRGEKVQIASLWHEEIGERRGKLERKQIQ